MVADTKDSVGIVVIGLNEGLHLKSCLESCTPQSSNIVFVDSGSTDDSLDIAEMLHTPSVSDNTRGVITAAEARNTGFDWILENISGIKSKSK